MPCSVVYLLYFLYSLTGCQAEIWSMSVPDQVNSTKGHSAVLPCSFTHPKQQSFTGEILIKWIIGNFHGNAIFQCSVGNSTEGRSDKCLDPSAPGRYTLQGNPQKRDLSLLIHSLEFSDINRYFCRVELDKNKRMMYQDKTGIWLHVSSPAEILHFSLVPGPMPGNGSLECVAEGNPRPTLACFSSAGPVPRGLITKATGMFRVTGRVPITSQDTYICRATNQHGTVERTFPSHPGPSAHTLGLSISGALILLGLVFVLLWLLRKGTIRSCSFENRVVRSRQKCAAHSQPAAVSEIPLYANSSEIGGNTELVYADINTSHFTKRPQRLVMTLDDDVNYAEVTFR